MALVQVNPVVGDLDGNVERIRRVLDKVDDCDLAVFGEMALTGYPLEDLVLKPGFVADSRAALEKVAGASGDCALVVGFADGGEDAVYNAVAVCQGGRVHGVYRKRHLPNLEVFDEIRHFSPGVGPLVLYQVGGVRVGLVICEDLWVPDGPVRALVAGGAELVVVANGSPFHRGKQMDRESVVVANATSSGRPLAYVNLVGGQDELVFDGGSMLADPSGRIVARAPRFDEAVVIVDTEVPDVPKLETDLQVVEVSKPRSRDDDVVATPVADLDSLAELYQALVTATGDYVRKSGFTDVSLGLSGGIDSALVATVAVDALGADHVHVVLMPSRYSSDHSVVDAEDLATNLGVGTLTVPIESAHTVLVSELVSSIAGSLTRVADENLQARIRGGMLMSLANTFDWLVLTTGNKSEAAVGYSTLYGDTVGAYAPIKDVYKTVVYELVRWRNKRDGAPVVPVSILEKAPSAELRHNQRDDDSLPRYEVLDPLLEAYIEGDRTRVELVRDGFDADLVEEVVRLVDRAEFKRRQNPPGVRVTQKGFGRDRRLPLVNRYRG